MTVSDLALRIVLLERETMPLLKSPHTTGQ
jgi:hypothetical protein